MRSIFCLAAFAALASAADPKAEFPLSPLNLKTGLVGELWGKGFIKTSYDSSTCFTYRVAEVIGKDKLLLRATGWGYTGGGASREGASIFIILKVPTEDLVDGKAYEPTGFFKVAGTEKIESKTYYVLEVAPAPKAAPKKEPKPEEAPLPPEPKPEPKPDLTPVHKAAYIRIHAAIAKVEAEAAVKFEGKLDTAPAKFFIAKETSKLLDALAKQLTISRAALSLNCSIYC